MCGADRPTRQSGQACNRYPVPMARIRNGGIGEPGRSSDVADAQVSVSGDGGDETGRRFSYQYAYAACLACAVLLEDEDVLEVFCEHHEDVLVKRRSGKLKGIQVKTRQLGSDPWKSGDEAILAAVAKFVRTDMDYPGQFSEFEVATNHQFFAARENGSNLLYLLTLAAAAASASATNGILHKYIGKLAKQVGCTEGEVLATLKKTQCNHDLPKLRDIHKCLCDGIRTSHTPSNDCTYEQLARLADALAAEATRASTLHHEQALPIYLGALTSKVAVETAAAVNGKRLTRERIDGVLRDARGSSGTLLVPEHGGSPLPLPRHQSVLAEKLTAGGLSVTTQHAARDWWSAALGQQLEWNNKLGEERALQRYRHLKTLVQSEAAGAYEESKKESGPFGFEMLTALRRRFGERRAGGDTPLFNSADEQLLGRAAMLTEECKVWWSTPFHVASAG
jgi:hypothetical protein